MNFTPKADASQPSFLVLFGNKSMVILDKHPPWLNISHCCNQMCFWSSLNSGPTSSYLFGLSYVASRPSFPKCLGDGAFHSNCCPYAQKREPAAGNPSPYSIGGLFVPSLPRAELQGFRRGKKKDEPPTPVPTKEGRKEQAPFGPFPGHRGIYRGCYFPLKTLMPWAGKQGDNRAAW